MKRLKSQHGLKRKFIQQLSIQDLNDPVLQLKLQKFIKDNSQLKSIKQN